VLRAGHIGAARSSDAAAATLGIGYHRQRRAIVVSATGFALLIIAAAWLLTTQWRLRALEAAESEEQKLSIALSELMARSLDSVDILLRSVVETVGTGDLADPDFVQRLHNTLRDRALSVPPVRALIVRDATGRMVTFSLWHPPPNIPGADRDYFIALRDSAKEDLFVGVPSRSQIKNEWRINVARRLSRPDGSFAGIVVATIEPLYYEQVYAAINRSPGGSIAMFRKDGVLLARHPHAEEMMGKSIGDTPFRNLLGHSTEPIVGRVVSGIDGVARIIAGRFNSVFPIYVAVSQREDAVLATWRRDATYLLVGTSIVLLALGLLTSRMLQQTARRETAERETVEARFRAEAASEAKTSFLANMSHELRTPLNAILGFSEMITSETFGPLGSPRYAEYAADINASGRHLLDLVDQVLDMSKIEAGQYSLNLETVDLADIIAACLPMTEQRAREKGVSITSEVGSAVLSVRADMRAAKQVLLNLLSNAVKFSPPGAQIVISARRLASGESELGVADTGIGISAQDLVHIFEPFARGDHLLAQREDGIGLGLPISQHLMTLQGGVVRVESVLGAGTTATMRFPAALP
jgi:signal transduction histidine kinase